MDNLAEQFNQMLADPGRLKQIMEMASALSAQLGTSPEHFESELPPQFAQLLNRTQEKEEKQQALVQALLPYLRPSHQIRLQKAMKIAQLSLLATAAFRSSPPQVQKEVAHV